MNSVPLIEYHKLRTLICVQVWLLPIKSKSNQKSKVGRLLVRNPTNLAYYILLFDHASVSLEFVHVLNAQELVIESTLKPRSE